MAGIWTALASFTDVLVAGCSTGQDGQLHSGGGGWPQPLRCPGQWRQRLLVTVSMTAISSQRTQATSGRPRAPEVEPVAIGQLVMGYTPRHVRLDDDHVRSLMEVIERLPPLVVHGETMTVLDGVHRLEAARRAGLDSVKAILFSGSDIEALAIAIQANVRHGKPLTPAERQAAAAVLLRRAPERSDRWVADTCGLSHTTVARIRQALDTKQQSVRTGRDGKARPVNASQGRSAVASALGQDPELSLRQAAKLAGVSPNTARRVAAELKRPERAGFSAAQQTTMPGVALVELAACPQPSLPAWTSTWWERTNVLFEDGAIDLGTVPAEHVDTVIDECRRRSRAWVHLAEDLSKRARQPSTRRMGKARA